MNGISIKKFSVALLFVILLLINVCRPIEASSLNRVFCRSQTQNKKIALTFDDRPHPRFTEQILEILDEYGVTATFFIIGINAERYPDALRKIYDSGCEIGNHTYSHIRIKNLSASEIRAEIEKCEEALHNLLGIRPVLFRPPEGLMPPGLCDILSTKDYHTILWSIDTLDWAHTPVNEIVRLIKTQLRGGDIILMHDYVSGKNTTLDALRLFIPQLLQEGYEFVTVSELIKGDCQ